MRLCSTYVMAVHRMHAVLLTFEACKLYEGFGYMFWYSRLRRLTGP